MKRIKVENLLENTRRHSVKKSTTAVHRLILVIIWRDQSYNSFGVYSYVNKLGDNCIQNIHLGRYIVGYTVGNLVLRRRASGAVKRDFRTYIRRYTSPNENFECGYPHSNAILQFRLESERWKPHKAARHPRKCDVINDVKLFPAVYRRICCRKCLTLSNQTSRYISKCIRMMFLLHVQAKVMLTLY